MRENVISPSFHLRPPGVGAPRIPLLRPRARPRLGCLGGRWTVATSVANGATFRIPRRVFLGRIVGLHIRCIPWGRKGLPTISTSGALRNTSTIHLRELRRVNVTSFRRYHSPICGRILGGKVGHNRRWRGGQRGLSKQFYNANLWICRESGRRSSVIPSPHRGARVRRTGASKKREAATQSQMGETKPKISAQSEAASRHGAPGPNFF